jgi:hypothetical protein
MNNNELDNLVESFLSPKQQSKAMELKELFALFESMEKLNEVVASGGFLPTVAATQKKYEPEAQPETVFYKVLQDVLTTEVLAKSQGQDASTKIKQLIKVVNFIKQTDLSKVESATLSKTFSTILFVSSLHKMIEDIVPDLPSTAGFFFEKFIGFMLKGTVQTTTDKDRYPIYDIVVNDPEEYVSMKLLKSFGIEGSIANMYNYFTSQTGRLPINVDENLIPLDQNGSPIQTNKKITYIIATKGEHSLRFYSYKFDLNQFLKMLGKPNIDKYNISLQSGQKKKDLKTELDNLSSRIKFLEASPQQTQDEIQDLKNQQRDVLIQLNTMDTKGATQFDFSQAKLAEAGVTAIMNGEKEDVLSLSAEQRDTVIEKNHSIFQEDIKLIIEESNLVYYKINNFILSNKGNANEAYDSVKTLEQHLAKYVQSTT